MTTNEGPIISFEKALRLFKDREPDGLGIHDAGAKMDAEKPRVGLVVDGFAHALLEVAKVGTYGANKYSDNGWRQVRDGEARYKDALLRHLLLASSEERDQESSLHHLAQVAWNALAVLELHLIREPEEVIP